MGSPPEPIWWLTKDGDKSCLALYERHYSAYKYKDGRARYQFVGPGYSIVLRTARADAMFVWRDYIDDTIPAQDGIECCIFRNEGKIASSNLIRQADAVADQVWPGQRHYTKVDPKAVGSGYPGWCFIRAGWRKCGMTQNGKLILERLHRKHTFHCPACDEQGTIELPDRFVTFGCPAECGASFAKYQARAGWAIRCVVQPVFRSPQVTNDPS